MENLGIVYSAVGLHSRRGVVPDTPHFLDAPENFDRVRRAILDQTQDPQAFARGARRGSARAMP